MNRTRIDLSNEETRRDLETLSIAEFAKKYNISERTVFRYRRKLKNNNSEKKNDTYNIYNNNINNNIETEKIEIASIEQEKNDENEVIEVIDTSKQTQETITDNDIETIKTLANTVYKLLLDFFNRTIEDEKFKEFIEKVSVMWKRIFDKNNFNIAQFDVIDYILLAALHYEFFFVLAKKKEKEEKTNNTEMRKVEIQQEKQTQREASNFQQQQNKYGYTIDELIELQRGP